MIFRLIEKTDGLINNHICDGKDLHAEVKIREIEEKIEILLRMKKALSDLMIS
ncbi:MAG: hypothetical protein HY730_06770 [Candidatus Tectomicrobia bacterium]|uniref:Uncharacterized protein n=1 Tax=Tectimicrobiota bacterium TaxID=2528274 RepID=A0A933GMW6_UNCTE|nr:hypothetical protein [Candidatus Tectomicrobia bacterium]